MAGSKSYATPAGHAKTTGPPAARSCADLGGDAQALTEQLPRQEPRAYQVEPGLHGVSTGTGARLVYLSPDLCRGGPPGPGFRGKFVLGHHAGAALLLLNGPL